MEFYFFYVFWKTDFILLWKNNIIFNFLVSYYGWRSVNSGLFFENKLLKKKKDKVAEYEAISYFEILSFLENA